MLSNMSTCSCAYTLLFLVLAVNEFYIVTCSSSSHPFLCILATVNRCVLCCTGPVRKSKDCMPGNSVQVYTARDYVSHKTSSESLHAGNIRLCLFNLQILFFSHRMMLSLMSKLSHWGAQYCDKYSRPVHYVMNSPCIIVQYRNLT